ncbi:MAG TPA: hypothetical protein DHV53_00550 [Gammaproteobacteria bacterium]|nr:hypothetical protein [Gammaproteobacteria bacterium]RPG46016.1 MAG: hypothetical protein CBD23_002385 [Gammaproteobacteria bacterium TMED163]HAO89174.1 hypothetical protein [Gammaproteobacteria bacterium]HAR90878.1 hypothetical protein [Gammaproteobacteria bacterium]HBJ90336.1 hypothetical protein [Gammaproteobacteria bacterium]|tara:strand:- start:123 stop:806 length:684 start_codon:yes stop_codon:yes gene_type:complete
MIWIFTAIVFGLLLYTCREPNLARPLTLSADGVELFPIFDKQAVLQRLPVGYEFLDYRYSITGCSLSTFHRDVTSSPFLFKTRHPVYTLISYGSEGKLLSVVPGSQASVPFVWGAPRVIDSTQAKAVLFHCDVLHAGVISRDPQRLAVQYKIAHRNDLPLLAELQGIDVDKRETTSIALGYEWLSRKLSLMFPFLINHVFTRYLQRQSNTLLNRLLLTVFGRSFYNR